MWSWKQILAFVLAVAAMWAIVPLMVWGGTGSLSRALQALRQYLGVLGMLAAAGVGVAALVLLAQVIG